MVSTVETLSTEEKAKQNRKENQEEIKNVCTSFSRF